MNKHDGLKLRCILLCLVLIISGMLVMPTITGADDEFLGTRAPEDPLFNGTNDHDPGIMVNQPSFDNISNKVGNMIVVNITVTDDDEPNNGSYIENVSVELGQLGAPSTWVDMEYWPMVNDNKTRMTGRWIYNLTFATAPAVGMYIVHINASDSGNITDGGMYKRFTVTQFPMTIHQENRAPTAGTAGELEIEEDNVTATFHLTTIFNDADIDTPPAYTDPDSYTFSMWDGSDFVNFFDFGNYTITVDASSGAVGFIPEDNWFNVEAFTDTGDVITFHAEDSHGMGVNNTVEFKVMSMNDMPMILETDMWERQPALGLSMDKFAGLEDNWWWLWVNATDNDTANPTPDTLLFNVETEGTSTGLPSKMQVSADGFFNFTPTNSDVGTWTLNVSVEDGDGEKDYMHIWFEVTNTNDEPYLTYAFAGNDPATLPANKKAITDNEVALTGAVEDTKFNFTVEAMDIDPSPTLTFSVAEGGATKVAAVGTMGYNFAFTPDNDDALAGSVEFNITVGDGSTPDDYVVVTVAVTGTNDPPDFDEYDGDDPPVDRMDDRGMITVGEYDNFTIMASDIDGDSLTVGATSFVTGLTVTDENGTWYFSFNPVESQADDYVNVTIEIDDGTVADHINITWFVESAIVIPPNNAPSITITTAAGTKFELGDRIVITGTVTDPDSTDTTADGTLEVMVEVVMPGDTAIGEYDYIMTSTGLLDWITYSGSDWTYTYDTTYLETQADLAKLLGIDMKLDGTYTFYFIAVDDDGDESEPVSVTIDVKDSDDDDDDVEGLLGLAIGLCLLLIIVPIVILIIIIVLVLKMRKKKAAPEAPPEMPPPAPMVCMQCGVEIPAGQPNCPACGAPAPEAPPAAPMACTQCGAEVPPGAPTCPACGAPAPAPAEGAPMDTVCECGATIPAGSPTCPTCGRPAPAPLPPEGAPMACPACGAEIPAGYPTCPACGAAAPAPPEMPPEEGEAPMEGEAPPEQPPADQAAQMVACPTCGAQIAVGATPCPSCGTALNWG